MEAADVLTFNSETHRYRLNGRPVRGVTRILESVFRQYDGVQSDDLVRGRDLGLAVHAATEFFDDGTLDVASVHPNVKPGLDAWVEWRRVTGFVPTQIEIPIASRTWWFAGRLDRLGYFEADPLVPVIVDLKFVRNLSPATALQTAGYGIAASEWFGLSTFPRRFAVKLGRDGRPWAAEYSDDRDRQMFLAVAAVSDWGSEVGLLREAA